MAVEAPLSRYRRTNLLIYIGACIALALWFAYDGYLNQGFIAEHTTEQGQPEGTLVFNQMAPFFLIPGALLLGAYWYAIRNRRRRCYISVCREVPNFNAIICIHSVQVAVI